MLNENSSALATLIPGVEMGATAVVRVGRVVTEERGVARGVMEEEARVDAVEEERVGREEREGREGREGMGRGGERVRGVEGRGVMEGGRMRRRRRGRGGRGWGRWGGRERWRWVWRCGWGWR